MKKNKILKISILVLSIVAIFLVIGITYAYFASTHQDDEDNILASSCFNLELIANNILSEGNIPMTDDDAKTLTPYSFTIKNTCGTPAEVGINLDILKTTNATLSNYKVSLSNGASLAPTLINDLESDEIANDDTLLTKKLTSVYIAGKNEKTIELRLWMKDSVGVGEGENEIIESKISLTATAVSVQYNPVQEKIIADNGGILKVRGKKDINLSKISPTVIYEENKPVEDETKTTIRVGLTRKYADSYTFDLEGGIYTLNNPVSEVLSEKHIGMYTCKSTSDTCTTLYQIKKADINPANTGYSASVPQEKTLNATSTLNGNRTFGKSFSMNTRGQFVLSDKITNASFTEDYIGYYVCSNSASSIASTTLSTCNYLHQILEVKSDPGEGQYYNKETLNYAVSFTSTNDKTVSTTYTFDNETGTFTLTDPTISISYSSDYVGYYTCNNNEISCTTLYKINEVNDSTITNVDAMVKTTRYNRLTKSNVYQKVTNNSYITLADKYTATPIDYLRQNTGLYLGEDDFGDTYYFRGGNDYNNLYFAGYYWNIVRINGDGSLRIIYRGTIPTATGENSKIEDSVYSSSYQYNAYIGFMYGSGDSSEYKLEHGNKFNSSIKTILDKWYESNLLLSNDYIADSIFCNDRSLYSGSGYGNSYSNYNGYYRVRNSNNLTPDFKCSQKNDRFTVSNNYGNTLLNYPIGLLTTDEAGFAGLYNTSTSTYNYLNTGIDYWTMTPSRFSSSAYVNYITSTGAIGEQVTNTSMGVRPVINLKGNVILSGTGTLEDPYRVEGLQTE